MINRPSAPVHTALVAMYFIANSVSEMIRQLGRQGSAKAIGLPVKKCLAGQNRVIYINGMYQFSKDAT